MKSKKSFKATNKIPIKDAPETIRNIRNFIDANQPQNKDVHLTEEGKAQWQKLVNKVETTDEIAFLYDNKHVLKHFSNAGAKLFKQSDIGRHAHQLLMSTADRHLKCPENLNQLFQNQQQSVYEIIRAFDGKKNIPRQISTEHLIQTKNGKIIKVSMCFNLICTENKHLVGTVLTVRKEVLTKYRNIEFFGENGLVSPTPQELVECYGTQLLDGFFQDEKKYWLNVPNQTNDIFIQKYLDHIFVGTQKNIAEKLNAHSKKTKQY